MKFEFEINDDELFDCDDWNCTSVNFKELLQEKVVNCIADKLWKDVSHQAIRDSTYDAFKQILKSRENDIIDKVVSYVSESISRKKQIMEMTPKVKDLAALDKDNESYFMELIDKAIAKRFK